MSMNETDMANALCLAHRILQYEMPPLVSFIRRVYKNKTLKIASRFFLQVSNKEIKRVNLQQQTHIERREEVPPVCGLNITDTSVIELEMFMKTPTHISRKLTR